MCLGWSTSNVEEVRCVNFLEAERISCITLAEPLSASWRHWFHDCLLSWAAFIAAGSKLTSHELGELSGLGPPRMLALGRMSTQPATDNHRMSVGPYIQACTRILLHQAGLLKLSGRHVSGLLRSSLYCQFELMPYSIKPLPAATDMDIASN
eukprot:5829432-Pyramimonas_sp.AAC.1